MRDNVQSDWNDSCNEAVRGSETVKEREGFAERTGEFLVGTSHVANLFRHPVVVREKTNNKYSISVTTRVNDCN